jgi:hypothetical protein
MSLRMTRRQKVSLSWMRSVAQSASVLRLHRVARRGHVAADRAGEQIQVFRRPCRQVLREQSRSPGQQKSLARRLKNNLVTSSWKSDAYDPGGLAQIRP